MSTSNYTQIVNAICDDLTEEPDRRLRIGNVHDRLQELAKAEPDPTLQALSDACLALNRRARTPAFVAASGSCRGQVLFEAGFVRRARRGGLSLRVRLGRFAAQS